MKETQYDLRQSGKMTQHDLDQYERDTVWPKERHSKTWICIKETQWDARQCYSDTVMAWDSVRKLFPFLSDLSLFLLGFLSLSLLGLLSHSLLSFCSDTLIGWVLCYSKLWSFKAHSTLYEVKESGTVLKIYYIIYIRIKTEPVTVRAFMQRYMSGFLGTNIHYTVCI